MNQRQRVINLLREGFVGNAQDIMKKLDIKHLTPYSLFRDLEKEGITEWSSEKGGWILK